MHGRTESETDPAPVDIVNPDGAAPLLIICDHGGCAVPRALTDARGPLGIPAADLQRHIGWDIGASAVARELAQRLGASAVLAVYSRLLIDPNRALGDPDCIPASSDGIAIGPNASVDAPLLRERADAYYWPYHTAIDRELARLMRGGPVPLLLSVHSFTPALMRAGSARPMQVGIMASRDLRLSDRLVAALKQRPGMTVTFNEPYSGITHGYCLKLHGLAQGIPHAQVEIRQDLICTAAGQAWWAGLLAGILAPIVADPAIHAIEHY
jgi:predicted N-formylglutamate amidohydrolase